MEARREKKADAVYFLCAHGLLRQLKTHILEIS